MEGSERADRLAREGSATSSCGSEPLKPTPHSVCVRAMKDWVRSEFANHWSAYDGARREIGQGIYVNSLVSDLKFSFQFLGQSNVIITIVIILQIH